MSDAYLDIETTGLSWHHEITVIGIYRVNGPVGKVIQLVGRQVNADNLLRIVKGVNSLYTFNGSRFDLPFIYRRLGVRLEVIACHRDLMYDCWRCNLFGGLKKVEEQLGIPRQLQGISGVEAVILWQRYLEYGDHKALTTLLEYNKEDVINLELLRNRLKLSGNAYTRHRSEE